MGEDPTEGDAAHAEDAEATRGEVDDRNRALPDEVPYREAVEPGSTALPRRLESWRRRSAAGAVFTGMAFGLREVFEPPTNEPAVVLETSGTPPKDLPVEADLDDAPARLTVVRIRPWLLDDDAEGAQEAERPVRELAAPPRRARSRRRGRRQ